MNNTTFGHQGQRSFVPDATVFKARPLRSSAGQSRQGLMVQAIAEAEKQQIQTPSSSAVSHATRIEMCHCIFGVEWHGQQKTMPAQRSHHICCHNCKDELFFHPEISACKALPFLQKPQAPEGTPVVQMVGRQAELNEGLAP